MFFASIYKNMDAIAAFDAAVVATDQAITDAQAATQAHGDLSDEYFDALHAQFDVAQAVVAAFGAAYAADDGPPSEQVQQAMQNTQRFGTGAGNYRNVLGVQSSAVSAGMYRIVGKGQRSGGWLDGR